MTEEQRNPLSGEPEDEEEETQPEEEPQPEEELEPETDKDRDALERIAGLSEKDKDDLFGTSGVLDSSDEEDDDFSDLTDLTDEDEDDLFGTGAPKNEPFKKRYKATPSGRRVARRETPPTSMGGVK